MAWAAAASPSTRVALVNGKWHINGEVTSRGAATEGLLMNVRMVNAVFEDRHRPDFDAEANTTKFIERLPDYAASGIRAVTVCLQGGMPGYEGALNSAFEPDGTLRPAYLARVERVIRACSRQGLAVILGLYYQRQSALLRDEAAVRAGVVNAARWVRERGFENVLLEIANEYPHRGFAHACIRDPKSQASLIRLARETAPGLLASASGYGDGKVHAEVAEAADFLLPHWNSTRPEQIPARLSALRQYGKAIVANEDDKTGADAVAALRASVDNGASYGLMLQKHNQTFPFHFDGAADDPVFYAELRRLTAAAEAPMDYWVAPMKETHAHFTGTRGTFAQFGDSISFTLAFWAPLAWEAKHLDPQAAQARQRVQHYMKPECWNKWKGPQFGNQGSMTIRWALENVDTWLKTLNPEVAVILFGSNDVGQMDASEYEAKTRQVSQRCLANGTIVLLTTMPPRSGQLEKSRQFAQVARGLARELKIPLVDYSAEILQRRLEDWDGSLSQFKDSPGDEYQVPTLIARDGVHPSNPAPWVSDYSPEGLRHNGYTLRNYLTLLAYAEVIAKVLEPAP